MPSDLRDGDGQLSRISQTHPEYPRDLAFDLRRSQLTDGRNQIGRLIQDMYRTDGVEYVGVRTGPQGQLAGGGPDVILEHRFRAPASNVEGAR